MGEPKATATPAALAAVSISRILPEMWETSFVEVRNPEAGGRDGQRYLDFERTEKTCWLQRIRYNMRRARRVLLFPH